MVHDKAGGIFDHTQSFPCPVGVGVEQAPDSGVLSPSPACKAGEGWGEGRTGTCPHPDLLPSFGREQEVEFPYAFNTLWISALVDRPLTSGMRTTFFTRSRPTIST